MKARHEWGGTWRKGHHVGQIIDALSLCLVELRGCDCEVGAARRPLAACSPTQLSRPQLRYFNYSCTTQNFTNSVMYKRRFDTIKKTMEHWWKQRKGIKFWKTNIVVNRQFSYPIAWEGPSFWKKKHTFFPVNIFSWTLKAENNYCIGWSGFVPYYNMLINK